jgi:hypothetical protein
LEQASESIGRLNQSQISGRVSADTGTPGTQAPPIDCEKSQLLVEGCYCISGLTSEIQGQSQKNPADEVTIEPRDRVQLPYAGRVALHHAIDQ